PGPLRLCSLGRSSVAFHWAHPAKGHQQPHRVTNSKILRRRVPAVHEFLLVVRRAQIGPHLSLRVVVKTKIGRGKVFFQNCHPRKQAHGSALDAIRWRQQHFTLALEERSRDPPHHVLRETNRAVLQRDVNRRSIQRCPPHLIHPRRIQSHLPQLQIQRLRRLV